MMTARRYECLRTRAGREGLIDRKVRWTEYSVAGHLSLIAVMHPSPRKPDSPGMTKVANV